MLARVLVEGGGNVNHVFAETSLFSDIAKQYASEMFEMGSM
jgi:riboflavin biosynthesis pyrimidine reductase